MPAAGIEFDQREIVNAIIAAGLGPTNADLTQLTQTFKMVDVLNRFKLAGNTGSPNAWSAQIPTLPISPQPGGTAIWFRPGYASVKGGTYLSLNGAPYAQVLHTDYSPIDIGDVSQNAWLLLFFDGSNWLMIAGGTQRTGAIPVLQTNAYWYVNAAIGSDTNYDGTQPNVLSSTVGPFKTIQRACDECQKYNMNGYNQYVSVADGDYPPFSAGQTNGVGTVVITGNNNSLGNVTITATGVAQCCIFQTGGTYTFEGFRLATFGNAMDCIAVNNSSSFCQLGRMQFGPAVRSQIAAAWECEVRLTGDLMIIESGANATHHMLCEYNASIAVPAQQGHPPWPVLEMLGPVSYSHAFITVDNGASTFVLYSNMPGSGYGSGNRFDVTMNGIINVNGNGPAYYPGTSPGSQSAGGQYG